MGQQTLLARGGVTCVDRRDFTHGDLTVLKRMGMMVLPPTLPAAWSCVG